MTGKCIRCGDETTNTVKTYHSEIPSRVHCCVPYERKINTNSSYGAMKR